MEEDISTSVEDIKPKIGIIKLVDLNKLIDKPKAWLEEALMIPEIINLDSDSDTEVSKKDDTSKKTKSQNSNATASEHKSDSNHSFYNDVQSRNRDKQENLKNKFSQLKEKHDMRWSKTQDKREQSNDDSFQCRKTNHKRDSIDKSDDIRMKCAPCSVVLEKLDTATLVSKLSKSSKARASSSSSPDTDDDLPLIKLIHKSNSELHNNIMEDKNSTKRNRTKHGGQSMDSSDKEQSTTSKRHVHKKKAPSRRKRYHETSSESDYTPGKKSDEEKLEVVTILSSEDEFVPAKPKKTENKSKTDRSVNGIKKKQKQEFISDSEESVKESKSETFTDKSEKSSDKNARNSSSSSDSDGNQKEEIPASKEDETGKVNQKDASKNKQVVTSDPDEESTSKVEDSHVEQSDSSDKIAKKDNKKHKRILTSDSEDETEKQSKNQDSDQHNTSKDDKIESPVSSGEEFFQTKLKQKKNTSSETDSGSKSNEKKARRRIKIVDSDESSDGGGNTQSGKSRKKIRKVLKTDSLSKSTLDAAKEEMERKKRIHDRQQKYNALYDLKLDEKAKVDKVVLDFDPDTKEELVSVHKELVDKLKPHQAIGVKFMWNACFESLEQTKKSKGSGCILAHCMGLGKTLQVVTLIHTLLTHEETGVKKVLVVCPLSTVLNWVNEFKIWLSKINDGDDVNVFEISKYKQMYERAYHVNDWIECGGVLIIGYEMFRNLSSTTNKRIRKKILKSFQTGLVDPGPDLVVCDEGHLLKNEKSRLSIAMNCIKTSRRIVLTGTPVQNNLKEYYCMIQFVKPNLLGKYNEYTNRFVNPITNGQYTDSTPHDIAVMKRRSHVLHKMLDGVVQRKDYAVLAPFLPPKHEYVVFISLTEIQIKLYETYMKDFARRMLTGGKAVALFSDFQALQRIWTHPKMLRAYSDKYEQDREKREEDNSTDSEGSLRDFIDDDESTPDTSDDDWDDAKTPTRPTKRRTRANAAEIPEEPELVLPVEKRENPTEWWCKYVDEEALNDVSHSGKLMLLLDILKKSETIGDKVLVFSQSLYSLDVIENFLEKVDDCTQNGKNTDSVAGHSGSWSLGLDYFRLDGSSSIENRSMWCKCFNNTDNTRARLFLISTKAGGLGINLVAANRVIIFDVSWNPSHDIQSIFRIYRFGQKKPCYIYRFIAMGTMEEKVYERQVTKQAISKRVIDEQQIDRHYNQNDLAELYKFEPVPTETRPVPNLPKDRLFAELLIEHEKFIYKYHEHDSLLENKEEEELDEAERRAAWDEFENEKKRPNISANLPNGMPRMNLSLQDASFAFEVMLRHENPTWQDTQIRQTVPLLVQQMYQQAAAGNWGMYNRVINYQITFQQQQWLQQARLMGLGNSNSELAQLQLMQLQQQQRASVNNMAANSSGFNPNEVVTLD